MYACFECTYVFMAVFGLVICVSFLCDLLYFFFICVCFVCVFVHACLYLCFFCLGMFIFLCMFLSLCLCACVYLGVIACYMSVDRKINK